MRTKKPIKIEVIRGRADKDEIMKAKEQGKEPRAAVAGEVLMAYPDPHRTQYYKIYRTFKTGNRDPRPILIPKKDCRIVKEAKPNAN